MRFSSGSFRRRPGAQDLLGSLPPASSLAESFAWVWLPFLAMSMAVPDAGRDMFDKGA